MAERTVETHKCRCVPGCLGPVCIRGAEKKRDSRSLLNRVAALVATSTGRRVTRIDSLGNPYTSRHRTGVADCLLDSGARIQVFWKVGPFDSLEGVGRLGSVGNERTAYQSLATVDPPAPGLFEGDVSNGHALLVTEYIKAAYRVHKSPIPDALERAAARIGAFHEHVRPLVGRISLDCYGAETYSVWAERACRARPSLAWLPAVAERFSALMMGIQASVTIIHGDFYPDNVLVSPGHTTAVDWEWAGIGMGEIDLAALTEGWWAESTVAGCRRAYASARDVDPDDPRFGERLTAARLYLHLRWLGGRVQRRIDDGTRWRVHEAHALARSLGLLAKDAPTQP